MRYYILLFILMLCFFPYANAQEEAQGCSDDRYVADLFTEVKSETVQYGENTNLLGNNQKLFMDVYEPEGDMQEMRPLIIWAFGGSFIAGSREFMEPNCIDFAKKGYVSATIDYRLWDDPNPIAIPDSSGMIDIVIKAVGDMKAAIRYFRKDAATENKFRIDPNYIFVGGISAGGIVALHTAYLDAADEIPDFVQTAIEDNGGLEGSSGDTENLSYSSEVQGVLNLSGGLYKTEWMEMGEAPLASIHGNEDMTVPFGFGIAGIEVFTLRLDILSINGSSKLHQKANTLSLENVFILVEGGGHTDIYFESQFSEQVDAFETQSKTLLKNILCGETVSTSSLSLNETTFKAFPNPSNNQITFEVEAFKPLHQIVVYDLLGKAILELSPNENTTITKQQLGAGIFIATLQTQEGEQIGTPRKIIFN